MKKTPLLLLALLFYLNLSAQDLSHQLNQFLDQEGAKFNLPNIELRIVSKDSILYSRSIGESSSANIPYYIGSVSKSLSAFGVLRLIEQKKLTFESIVSDLLPEIEFANANKEITIRHLLQHTSGIKKSSGFKKLPSLEELKRSKHIIDNKNTSPLRHEYSNSNYAILGLVIEKVTQLSFKEYMKQALFSPLEMNNSLIGTREEVAPSLIKHYQYFGPFPIERPQSNYAKSSIPAGFICSSSEDLGKYLQVHLANGVFKEKKLMDSSFLQSMYTVWDKTDFGYAMGWKKGSYNDQVFYQHLGSTANSYSGIFSLPEKEIGFVFISNSNSLDFSEQMVEGILNILTDGQAKPVSRFEFFMRIGVIIGLFFVVLRFIYNLFFLLKEATQTSENNGRKDLLIAIVLLMLVIFAFPFVAQIPFFSFCKIQPDIGLLILFSLISPIALSLTKIVKQSFPHNKISKNNV